MKKSRRNCKLDLSDNCFSRTNAKCVNYEGVLSEYSELDPEQCLDVEEVIEDLGNIVDDIKDAIDVSEAGCCLRYTASDEETGLVIKDVVLAHEGLICDIMDKLDNISEDSVGCGSEVDECGNKVDCCKILKKHSFGVGENTLSSGDYWENLVHPSYSDLFYKLEKKGTYKVSVEMNYKFNAGGSIYIGLSVNDTYPMNNPFTKTEVFNAVSGVEHMSTDFIYDGIKGDILSIKLNCNLSKNVKVTMVKMIVEKVK